MLGITFLTVILSVLLIRQKVSTDLKIPVTGGSKESTSAGSKSGGDNGDIKKVIPSTLNSLDLSNQNLDKLPQHVLNRTNLEELNISNNNINGALPAEIRFLKNLKVLNASNNIMTGVPAEIGQLSNLEVLDLSNNKLTGLPYELGNLKKLKILILSGNSYSKQDLDLIKKGLPESTEIVL